MDVVKSAWSTLVVISPMFILTKKLEAVKAALLLWRKSFKDSNRISKLRLASDDVNGKLLLDPSNSTIQQAKFLTDVIA